MKRLSLVLLCVVLGTSNAKESSNSIQINTQGLQEPLRSAIEERVETFSRLSERGEPAELSALAGEMGKLLQAHGLHESAIVAYTQAHTLDEATEWLYLRAISRHEIGRIKLATKDFAEIVGRDPENPLFWYRYGEVLFVDGQIETAESAFQRTLELAPDHAAALVRLADLHLIRAKLDEALEFLLKAWDLDPTAGQVAFRISNVYKRMGRLRESRSWLAQRNERAPLVDDPLLQEVAQHSLSPTFYKSAGQKAWARDDVAGALASYEIAMSLGAHDEITVLDYANMLLLANQRSKLTPFLKNVLERFPTSARAWFIQAQLIASETPLKAADAARTSLALEHDVQVLTWLADHHMREQQFETARIIYQELLSEIPKHPYYLYWSALAHHRTGKCPAALQLLRELIQLQPNWGEALIVQTRSEALCGNPSNALLIAEKLVQVSDSVDTRLTKVLAQLANGTWSLHELPNSDKLHQDYKQFALAAKTGVLPPLPFHRHSTWWVPKRTSDR